MVVAGRKFVKDHRLQGVFHGALRPYISLWSPTCIQDFLPVFLLEYQSRRLFLLPYSFLSLVNSSLVTFRVSINNQFFVLQKTPVPPSPKTHLFVMLSLEFFLLSFLPLLAHAASGKGIVSLYGDSGCGTPNFTNFGEGIPDVLNFTLNADTCGTPGSVVHSYKVLQRPTCAHGNLAVFDYYRGQNCESEGSDPILNSDIKVDTYDNQCLALVEFNSLAFLCAGIGGTDGNANPSPISASSSSVSSSSVAVSSSPVAVTSTTASSAFATPLVPSATITSPLYPIPAGSSSSSTGTVGSVGIASGTSPATTSSIRASPLSFTGAASSFRMPAIKLVVLLGGLLLL